MVALDGWGRETWGSGAWGEEAPVSVSGVQSNTATGTLSTTADAVVIPNGFQLNIAEFDLTIIGDGSVTTGGEESTVEAFLGTPVITADAPSVTTTGVEAPALVGSVTVFAGAIPLPTGIELTSNVARRYCRVREYSSCHRIRSTLYFRGTYRSSGCSCFGHRSFNGFR
jgi:hypothetical protein